MTTEIVNPLGSELAAPTEPTPLPEDVRLAADKMVAAVRAGIPIAEWGDRTCEELTTAIEWWIRANAMFGGRIDLGWEEISEPSVCPRNSPRVMRVWCSHPARVDGNITRRFVHPQSLAIRIGPDGRGVAQAIRAVVESVCAQ